jgi:imidazolonepropionase-like amidohydrolase
MRPVPVPAPLRLVRLLAPAALASLAPASAAAAGTAPIIVPGNGTIAIKVGRIITQAGADIQNGVIVIRNGKIESVGPDTKAAWDVEVLDHPELVAFPGYVEAHTTRGMDRPNENIDVAPFLDVRDSIDPISFYFEDCLRSGMLTLNIQQGPPAPATGGCVIGAQGLVVKPFGMTVEQMLEKSDVGLKISAAPKAGKSRATQAQALRKAFTDLRRYLEKLVQDTKDGKDTARREALYQGKDLEKEENKKGRAMEGSATWKVKDLEIVPRGEIDDKQEPLLRLVEGKVGAFVYCDAAAAVPLALEVARENGFLARTTLVLDGDSWKAADLIAEAGVPVVLGANLVHVERDPVTGKEIETFVPGVFKKKKVRFALQSLNPQAQSLWYQAALCVGYGIDRKEALDAVTRTPADILHIGDRVGSLEPGKDGNVLLLSGDPLSATTTVNYVVLDGNLVYDRSKDVRVKHLLEGVEQENSGPTGADAQVKPPKDDDDKDDGSSTVEKKKDAGEKHDKKDEKKDGEKKDKDGKESGTGGGQSEVQESDLR